MENWEEKEPEGEESITPETRQPRQLPYIILLCFLMFVLGGILVFTYFTFLKPEKVGLQPTASPSLTSEVSPSPTSDIGKWKLYTNDDLGFSIKLPVDLEVIFQDKNRIDFATFPPMTSPYLTITSQLTDFDLASLCPEEAKIAPCIVNDYLDKTQKGIEDVGLGGTSAKSFYIWRTVGRKERVIQTVKDHEIELRFLFRECPPYDTIDQILSTFKFTE